MNRIVAAALFGTAAFLTIARFDAARAASASPPADAVAAGFTVNTLSSFASDSIDIHNTVRSGFSWYLWNFFGGHAKGDNILLNPDGSVTLNGDSPGPNGELATASPAKNAAKFVGTAFGGGAYIEAAIRFDPSLAHRKDMPGWPSFWALPLEHVATGADQWRGQAPGFQHFIEVDVFEYDIAEPGQGQNFYGANMHEWYGAYNRSCAPRAYCHVSRAYSDVKTAVSNGTDFTQAHTYGFLWVPATESAEGYAQFYFDRSPVGKKIKWTKFADQNGAPDGQPWQFGFLDSEHLVVILGTGIGKPMTVDSVNVWQSSDKLNMRN